MGSPRTLLGLANKALGGVHHQRPGFPGELRRSVPPLGDKIAIRFLNEGHHDASMASPTGCRCGDSRATGMPLGSAAFTCDTLGVNPGERWDVVVDCDEPGAWAFHCHILQHAEGRDGMFGMVTALVVQEPTAGVAPLSGSIAATSPIARAARAAGSTALVCQVPGI